MRVLLINSNRKNDLLAAAPIGLCYVASATESAGHAVRILDLCFLGNKASGELKLAIDSFKPEIIGISIRNIDNVNMLHSVSYLPEVVELMREIRKLTDCKVVLGGSAVSLAPEAILRLLDADYVVVSDGEEPFRSLLEAIGNKTDPAAIPGVGFLVNESFHLMPPQLSGFGEQRPDVGRWVDMAPYRKIGAAYNVQAKRGCRRHCVYCTYNQSIEGVRLRLRDPHDVVSEIEEVIKKYGQDHFEFVDSVFNDPIEHSRSILEEIAKKPWKAKFSAMGVHPRGLDQEYLDLMWRAGFRSLMITPESASESMLKNYRKGFSRKEVYDAASALNKSKFAVWWFFMVGGPGETNETLQESLDFVLNNLKKNGRAVTHVAQFFIGIRLYPGTALWETAEAEGFINSATNPLEPLWYVSEQLDLDRALSQMFYSASMCPEIYLGFDERVLSFSNAITSACRILHLKEPYWKYMRIGNVIGINSGIRFIFKDPDTAGLVRRMLAKQSYTGKLVSEHGHP